MAAPLVESIESTARAEEVRSIVPSTPESPGRPDPLLVTSGAALLLIPYGASAWAGAVSDNPSDHWLYAPVFGPLANLIARQTCSTVGCKGTPSVDAGPLIISGLLQAAGLAVLVTAFVSPGKPPTSAFALRVAPTTYRGGAGVAAFGAF